MIPALPTDAIRAALDAGEWDRASALLTEHEHAVREALATSGADADRDGWMTLLAAQRDMLAQLQSARDEAGQALQKLRRGSRGAGAYAAARG